MPDYIHLCVSIAPKYAVVHTIDLLKGKNGSEVMSFGSKNSRLIRGRTFLARGYCVSTICLNEEKIRECIRNQEHLDILAEESGLYNKR